MAGTSRVGRTSDRELILALLLLLFPISQFPFMSMSARVRKKGKLGKEIKDKRVGGSADKAGMETPILDDAGFIYAMGE